MKTVEESRDKTKECIKYLFKYDDGRRTDSLKHG